MKRVGQNVVNLNIVFGPNLFFFLKNINFFFFFFKSEIQPLVTNLIQKQLSKSTVLSLHHYIGAFR